MSRLLALSGSLHRFDCGTAIALMGKKPDECAAACADRKTRAAPHDSLAWRVAAIREAG